jgi:pyrimidine-nucleoside phosphorylase
MVVLAGKAKTVAEAIELLKESVASGRALETFKTFLSAQGGDASVVDQPELLPAAPFTIEVPAMEDGYIAALAAERIGTAAMMLGAGRATKDSVIDLAVGIVLRKKVGDYANKGESLAIIHSNRENVDDVLESLYASITLSSQPVNAPPLIYGVIGE